MAAGNGAGFALPASAPVRGGGRGAGNFEGMGAAFQGPLSPRLSRWAHEASVVRGQH